MQPELYQQAGQLFQRVIELPAEKWDTFLDDTCGENDSLRDAVMNLLRNDLPEDSDEVFGRPLRVGADRDPDATVTPGTRADAALPEQFGRYRIIRTINRGGMGVVYEAEQDQPRQRVALKVIAGDAATPKTMERFRQEAEILGQLRHPGIAQVYDAGESDVNGVTRPYIAMELIDGLPLIAAANAAELDIHDRMNLIADLCDAVQHAHDQGVVHRDIKPDNVLVNDRGEVKVLDFGIALVRSDRVDAMSMMTSHGQIVGTLNYMSPEQLSGDSKDIDRRSDVYALGVLMYELLANQQPHDLRNRSLPDAIRALSEDEPRPLASVCPEHRGDLATIVAKAMEKERARRYQSAAELGADVMRWLQHKPITARPVSTVYRIRKLARRNRAIFTGVTTAVIALTVGTTVASMQAVSAKRAQHNAERSEMSANAVRDFLIKEILLADTPEVAQGDEMTLRAAFLRAAERLSVLDDQPDIKADIHHTLGEAFLNLGDHRPSRDHFQAAFDIREERDGPLNRGTIESLLGICSAAKRIPPIEPVEALQREAYARSLEAFGPHDELTLDALANVASYVMLLDRMEEAVDIQRALLDSLEDMEDPDELFACEVQHNLADALSTLGRLDEAAVEIGKAIDGKTAKLGPMHPSTIISELVAGILEYRRENYIDARNKLRDLWARASDVCGPEHWYTVTAREMLGQSIVQSGVGIDEAEPHFRAALAIRLDPGHTNPQPGWIAADSRQLGLILVEQGRRSEAIELLLQAEEWYRRIDPEHEKLAEVAELLQQARDLPDDAGTE